MNGASKILLKEYNNRLLLFYWYDTTIKNCSKMSLTKRHLEREMEGDRIRDMLDNYDECLWLLSSLSLWLVVVLFCRQLGSSSIITLRFYFDLLSPLLLYDYAINGYFNSVLLVEFSMLARENMFFFFCLFFAISSIKFLMYQRNAHKYRTFTIFTRSHFTTPRKEEKKKQKFYALCEFLRP